MTDNAFDLQGCKVLVTGARHGIGAAAARALAASGATVALTGRNLGDCADAVATITATGGTAFEIALDVGDLGAASNAVAEATERLGGLDVLINNAGVIAPITPLSALDVAAFDRAVRINLTGPAALVRAAWPALAQSRGRVINMLSGAALRPLDGWSAYCSSKAGLHMLNQAIELEGGPSGIHSFGFAPGLVDTGMQSEIRESGVNEVSKVPQSALLPVEEPAQVITWISSGAADDLAGTMIDIRMADIRIRAGLPESVGV